MNFAIVCTRNPAFLAFKKAIGHDSALEFLFKLVERCQSEKTTEHYLPDDYIVAALARLSGFVSTFRDDSPLRG